MNAEERRKYRRAKSNLQVNFNIRDSSRSSRSYLQAIADDISFGGMFLATEESFSKGDILRIQMFPQDGEPLEVTGVVRWVRRFRKPRGVGIEFVEFHNLGDRSLDTLLSELLESN